MKALRFPNKRLQRPTLLNSKFYNTWVRKKAKQFARKLGDVPKYNLGI